MIPGDTVLLYTVLLVGAGHVPGLFGWLMVARVLGGG